MGRNSVARMEDRHDSRTASPSAIRRPGRSSRASGTRAMCRSWGHAPMRLWLGSTVFDGARAFEGVTPDLDRHCARVNESAINVRSQADRRSRHMAGSGARRHRAFPAECRALRPADVLAAERRRRRRALRSGNDAIGACASTKRRCESPSAARSRCRRSAADRRMRAGRCQGRLSLSELFARADRGRIARLPELPDAATCWATSRSSAIPTCSWRRMVRSTRRCRTAPS